MTLRVVTVTSKKQDVIYATLLALSCGKVFLILFTPRFSGSDKYRQGDLGVQGEVNLLILL